MKRLLIIILLIIFSLPAMGQYDLFGQYNNPFSVWGSKTKRPSVSIDVDAQALITRMTLAGNAPSLGRQALISYIFKMAKDSLGVLQLAGTVFDCFWVTDNYRYGHPEDTIWVKLNWIQDAYNLTSYGQITYDSSGVLGGTNKFFRTNYNPRSNAVSYSLNSASISVFSKTASTSAGYELGGRDGTSNWGLLSLYIGGRSYLDINQTGDVSSVTESNTSGLFIANRLSASLSDLNVNGISRTDENQTTSLAIPDIIFYYLGCNNAGSLLITDRKLAGGFIGKGFSEIECRKIFNIRMYWWANKNKAEYQ